MLLGGISGYRGGLIDAAIQRLIEFLRSIPTIPLWMALAAAVPRDWSMIRVYFAITVIISLIGWTTMAREVRGRFLAMREEDFVVSARLYGSSQLRIIFRHMLPSFMSHIIATTSLAVPAIIIAETSLSFLGLGLRQPAISWGVLLNEAQKLQAVASAPWLLVPGAFILVRSSASTSWATACATRPTRTQWSDSSQALVGPFPASGSATAKPCASTSPPSLRIVESLDE